MNITLLSSSSSPVEAATVSFRDLFMPLSLSLRSASDEAAAAMRDLSSSTCTQIVVLASSLSIYNVRQRGIVERNSCA